MKANRTETELTRQNIVLANFMELDMVYDSLNKMMTWTELESGNSYFTDELSYHNNDDWIASVCRKIENEGASVLVRPNDSNGFACKIQISDNRICYGASFDVREAIFEACVQYVEAVHEYDYPYSEGDEYYYDVDGTIFFGVWDDESRYHHQEFEPEYFTEEEILQLVREDGLKTKFRPKSGTPDPICSPCNLYGTTCTQYNCKKS
tara:strand:+ start:1014 stop:1634 length:621 start_codon:yes stop_codon:yes gene_type:complete